MCTATWLEHPSGGWEIFFNRDEQRSRPRAAAPSYHEVGRVPCVYPVDPAAGGTWLGMNGYGLVLAVLNFYGEEGIKVVDPVSRGLMVAGLLDARSPGEVFQRLENSGLPRRRPFLLLAFLPGHRPGLARWTGRVFSAGEPERPMLTTSSWETSSVCSARIRQYQALAVSGPLTPERLEAFHRSREPVPGPCAVCMERPDARTVSFSRVSVNGEEGRFIYEDGPPCENPAPTLTVLPLGGSPY